MRGSHLSRGTLQLISQWQRECSAGNLRSAKLASTSESAFPLSTALSSTQNVGGEAVEGDFSSDPVILKHGQVAEERKGSVSHQSSGIASTVLGQRRGFSSGAEAGRGRGYTNFGSSSQHKESSIGRGENSKTVQIDQAAEGQFEDAESDKKAKPTVQQPTSILQQILAASAKDNEEAAKRSESRKREQGASVGPSGRNGSGARLGTRPQTNNMQDLMRMFQPKNTPSSGDPSEGEGRLFQPRRTAGPPPSPPSRDVRLLREEISTLPSKEKDRTKILGYGERSAMQSEDRVIYWGAGSSGAGRGGGRSAENERQSLSLSEIFAKSKAEGEERGEPSGRVKYTRSGSQGRGKASASADFQQRVLGLPAAELSEPTGERAKQGPLSRYPLAVPRTSEERKRDEEDNGPPKYGEYAIASNIPQDKPRKEKQNRSADERKQYEAREAEREEKELQEAAKETEEEIESSEWFEKMKRGWEPQPEELGVPHMPEVDLRHHLAMNLEPEYTMEAFGVLPDLDEAPETSLEDALTACKEELMALSGIDDEDTWQAMLKRTLSRTSELEAVVRRYNKTANVSAAQQHQILGDIVREMPERGSPSRTPEMVAYVARALQTLEHNCRWPLERKKAVMTSLVAQFGKYDGSKKGSQMMQSIFG